MISKRPGGIDSDLGFEVQALEQMPENSFSCRRAANISQANEKDAASHFSPKV